LRANKPRQVRRNGRDFAGASVRWALNPYGLASK